MLVVLYPPSKSIRQAESQAFSMYIIIYDNSSAHAVHVFCRTIQHLVLDVLNFISFFLFYNIIYRSE